MPSIGCYYDGNELVISRRLYELAEAQAVILVCCDPRLSDTRICIKARLGQP
jgi:hypothetical protein